MRGPAGVINMRDEINKAVRMDSDAADFHGDRLMKPLSTFGFDGEMRELAAVVSRDIFSSNPGVRWSDIVGLDGARRLIKEAIVYPLKYPQLFTGILSPWKGLLLYGPSGTGKVRYYSVPIDHSVERIYHLDHAGEGRGH